MDKQHEQVKKLKKALKIYAKRMKNSEGAFIDFIMNFYKKAMEAKNF